MPPQFATRHCFLIVWYSMIAIWCLLVSAATGAAMAIRRVPGEGSLRGPLDLVLIADRARDGVRIGPRMDLSARGRVAEDADVLAHGASSPALATRTPTVPIVREPEMYPGYRADGAEFE